MAPPWPRPGALRSGLTATHPVMLCSSMNQWMRPRSCGSFRPMATVFGLCHVVYVVHLFQSRLSTSRSMSRGNTAGLSERVFNKFLPIYKLPYVCPQENRATSNNFGLCIFCERRPSILCILNWVFGIPVVSFTKMCSSFLSLPPHVSIWAPLLGNSFPPWHCPTKKPLCY